MKIGEALREVRLNLGLSQAKMCEGIVQRPFYALVESGKDVMILLNEKMNHHEYEKFTSAICGRIKTFFYSS